MALLIAVDSGHGLATVGKQTPPLPEDLTIAGKVLRKKGEVIHEKEWNRPTADFLISALQRCGFSTVDAAPGWNDIPLADRVKRANDAKADLFVSKHYNAASDKWWSPGYTVTFTCPANTATYAASQKAATAAQNIIAAANQYKNEGVQSDQSYLGFSVYVLRYTQMPAFLTETAFMDVWEQARKMLDPAAQQADAEATCQGICAYFNRAYIAPGGQPVEKWLATTITELNLRQQPNASANILTAMPKGAQVELLKAETNGWYQLIYQNKTGYANGSYLTVGSKPSAATPAGTDWEKLYKEAAAKIVTLTADNAKLKTDLTAAESKIKQAQNALK